MTYSRFVTTSRSSKYPDRKLWWIILARSEPAERNGCKPGPGLTYRGTWPGQETWKPEKMQNILSGLRIARASVSSLATAEMVSVLVLSS